MIYASRVSAEFEKPSILREKFGSGTRQFGLQHSPGISIRDKWTRVFSFNRSFNYRPILPIPTSSLHVIPATDFREALG